MFVDKVTKLKENEIRKLAHNFLDSTGKGRTNRSNFYLINKTKLMVIVCFSLLFSP